MGSHLQETADDDSCWLNTVYGYLGLSEVCFGKFLAGYALDPPGMSTVY